MNEWFLMLHFQHLRTEQSHWHDFFIKNLILNVTFHLQLLQNTYAKKVKLWVALLCSTLCDHMNPRLLCTWNSPGKNTGVGCHSLLQGIFLTQGSNPGLMHCRQTLYSLSHNAQIYWYVYLSVTSSLSISHIHHWWTFRLLPYLGNCK